MGLFDNTDPIRRLAQQVPSGNGNGAGSGGTVTLPGGFTATAGPLSTNQTPDLTGRSGGNGPVQTPTLSTSTSPNSLSSVPNPKLKDYFTQSDASMAEKLFSKDWWIGGGRSQVQGQPKLTTSGADQYIKDKTDRVLQIATLSGATPDQIEGLKQQIAYNLSQLPKSGDMEKDAAAADKILTDVETPLAQTTITNTSNGGDATTQNSASVYSPEQIAAIQSTIGQFMQPYADQAQLSGTNTSNILNEYANSGSLSPAYKGLIQSQAAQAKSGADAMAAAYMAQAQALPAITALQNQQQMANQIAQLQNQLLAQQSNGSGVGGNIDINALLASQAQSPIGG